MNTPSVISRFLRQLAARVDSSDSPSRSMVRAELAKALFAVRGEAREMRARRIAADILKLAQEEMETSMWDTEEGNSVDFAYGEARRKHGEQDNLDGALGLLKSKIDKLIVEIRRDPSEPRPGDDSDPSDVVTSAPPMKD